MRAAGERGALPEVSEDRELALAADEWNAGEDALACRARRRDCTPGLDRLGFAFRHNRRQLLVADRGDRRAVRLFANDDRPHGGGLLQARRCVDHVARNHRLAGTRSGVEGDDRVASVHRRPDLEVELRLLLVHRSHGVAHGECRADSALRVVPVRCRRAEDGHDRVADELLDNPAERLELVLHRRMERREDCAHILGIELIRASGEADQIDEDHADNPPLLTRRGRGGVERGPAGEAEPRVVRVLRAACLAHEHGRSVRGAARAA